MVVFAALVAHAEAAACPPCPTHTGWLLVSAMAGASISCFVLRRMLCAFAPALPIAEVSTAISIGLGARYRPALAVTSAARGSIVGSCVASQAAIRASSSIKVALYFGRLSRMQSKLTLCETSTRIQIMVAMMPAAEMAQIEKTTFSRKVRRVFGLGLHSWEQLMLLSLGIAALAALALAPNADPSFKALGEALIQALGGGYITYGVAPDLPDGKLRVIIGPKHP
jgi:hypothetical protein